MEGKVDFHIHTHFSDGCISPTAIVKRAKEQDYDMIAITDHDGVDGIKEAMIAGEAVGLKVIPGIELATETEEGTGLHILGYHIDVENEQLQKVLKQLLKARNNRNKKLLAALDEMGYPVQVSGKFVGKPTIARAMVKKGYISSPKEAFQGGKFLVSPQILDIKKEKLETAAAIDVITEAGGLPVLAHPIQIKGYGVPGSAGFYDRVDALIGKMKKWGLKGLECFHPDQTHEQSMEFVKIAEKYHLHITRGSDFHGDDFK